MTDEKLIEPLTDAEAEEAFIAVVTVLDKLNAAPAATVASKEGEGVAFSLYFSADRVRRLLAARAAIESLSPNGEDALREALPPCDVQLQPATTITAGCKLSTLIHALELRGMVTASPTPCSKELPDAGASAEADQALAVPVEPVSRLRPAGFDPSRMDCAPVAVEEDGWSEWLHPTPPSFFSQCCDCGLIHELRFEIVPRDEANTALNPGESDTGVIIFRARRAGHGA